MEYDERIARVVMQKLTKETIRCFAKEQESEFNNIQKMSNGNRDASRTNSNYTSRSFEKVVDEFNKKYGLKDRGDSINDKCGLSDLANRLNTKYLGGEDKMKHRRKQQESDAMSHVVELYNKKYGLK